MARIQARSLPAAAPAAPRALTAEALWALARVGTPVLSPDGRHAVCAVTQYDLGADRGRTQLWRLPTDRCAPQPLTTCGEKDGAPAWSPRGDRIAFLARRGQGDERDATPQLYLIGADGGEARRASDFAPGIECFKWLPDGRCVLFAAWTWPGLKGAAAQARAFAEHKARKVSGHATEEAFHRHWDRDFPTGRVLHLWLLDVDTGRATDLFEGTALELPRDTEDAHAFDPSPDGRRVVFAHDPADVQQTGNPLALSEMDLRTRRVTTLARDADWDFSAPRHAPDGGRIACLAAHVGRRHTALAQVAVIERGRAWGPSCIVAPEWDFHADAPLRWMADGSALLFTAEREGRRPLWRLPLAALEPQVVLPGGWVQGFDLAGDVLVTSSDSAAHPARVHAHRAGAQPLRLERFNDKELAGVATGAMREVTLTGALGEPVQMWLTFPPGFDARRRHPVMHVIHGGPFAAAGDTFSWRWNAHVLAARGHIVAQVNYHGSSGFGAAFRDSLIGRQGELELQDLEAATDWLLAQPWVDGRRIVATGGSYGGFLVAWMNGHVAPGRYQAYVCHAGVFDRVATFSADSYAVRPKDLGASFWDDMPRVLAQSPHAFAAAMRTPTLVIHGARDYRVPDCNGLAYYHTLKARGVPARLLWFPDENHWILRPQNSCLWYAEFLAWVERYTAPKVAP
jgi:dipeptidyl aminopeptidase/acylaminoacyl peptidase